MSSPPATPLGPASSESRLERVVALAERHIMILQDVGETAVARLVDGSSATPNLPEMRWHTTGGADAPGLLGRFALRRLGLDAAPTPGTGTPNTQPGRIQSTVAIVHHRRANGIYHTVGELSEDRERGRYHASVTGEDRGIPTEQLRGRRADLRATRSVFRLGPRNPRRGHDGRMHGVGYSPQPNHMPKPQYGSGPKTAQEVVAPGAPNRGPQVAVPESVRPTRSQRRNSQATIDLRARLRMESSQLRFEAFEALGGNERRQAVAEYLKLRLQSTGIRLHSRFAVANPNRGNGSTRSDARIAYPSLGSKAEIELINRLRIRASGRERRQSAEVLDRAFGLQEQALDAFAMVRIIGIVASAGHEAWANRGGSDDDPEDGGAPTRPLPLPGSPTTPTPPLGVPRPTRRRTPPGSP